MNKIETSFSQRAQQNLCSSDDLTLKEIKKELRAAMNGILSARMRAVGMPYKLIFGVELPRLQAIADEFSSSRTLAQLLWNQNVRECKLLACYLMPHGEFLPEMAEIWISEACTAECIQVMSLTLLNHQRWSAEMAFQWVASNSPSHQLAGMLMIVRLLAKGEILNPRSKVELLNQLDSLEPTATLHLRKAIQKVRVTLATTENGCTI